MLKNQAELNELLNEVICQAKALGIPVSLYINEKLIVNQRAKSRFGACKKIQNSTLKNQTSKRENSQYKIEISKALIDGPKKFIKEVLAHEILHTTPGGYNHTGNWKRYAKLMNESYGYHIRRTNSPESLGLNLEKEKLPAKYLIVCQKCGITIERNRRSKVVKQPSIYRCKCGGKLIAYLVK